MADDKSTKPIHHLKALWQNPEYRARMTELARLRIIEFNSTPRARSLRSKSSRANWSSPEIRNKMTTGMVATKAKRLSEKPPNEFESRCYSFIDQFGVDYERQYHIVEAHTIPDAYVPSINLCIYFDSEYWHSRPVNVARDTRIRKKLVALGYEVAVIRCDHWAREINKGDLDALRGRLCA